MTNVSWPNITIFLRLEVGSRRRLQTTEKGHVARSLARIWRPSFLHVSHHPSLRLPRLLITGKSWRFDDLRNGPFRVAWNTGRLRISACLQELRRREVEEQRAADIDLQSRHRLRPILRHEHRFVGRGKLRRRSVLNPCRHPRLVVRRLSPVDLRWSLLWIPQALHGTPSKD